MLKLDYSYDLSVESAYIITIKNHPISENMSQRCQESCRRVGMPFKVWDAFDGTSGNIIIPDHAKNKDYISWFKWVDKERSEEHTSELQSH